MAAPAPPRAPARWRWLAAAALLAPLVAAALWSATEPALQAAARAAERASGGRLELAGVAGSLYGPLTVERARYRDGATAVAAAGVELDWSPLALLAATVRIERLAARHIEVALAGDGAAAPAAAPANLRVPIRVELREARFDRVRIDAGGAAIALAPVAGSAKLGATRHTLALRELGTPWARVSGDAALGAWPPFRVHGRLSTGAIAAAGLQGADAVLNGTLARLEVRLAARAAWVAGDADAVVEPFAAQPLAALTLSLREIDLARVDPALPATRASLAARLERAGGALAGPVSLENALAGRLDEDRLPVSATTGTARFDGAQLAVDDLVVALGEAGRVTGRAEAGAAGYTAQLATDGVRLDRLHAALRPLAPAGTATLAGDGSGERAQVRLREGDAALELALRRQAQRLEVESARLTLPGGAATATGHLLLRDDYAFQASGRLAAFDPGRFVAMPPARLNGTVEASGALRPAWRAELAFRIAESTFAGAPASGDARLSVAGDRVVVPAARLAVGGNRVRAEGRLGAAGDRLAVEIDAPALERLGFGVAGALRASGWIGGTPADPAFALDASARGLRQGAFSADTLALTAQAAAGLGGHVRASVKAAGLRAGELALASAEAALEGSRGDHVLRAAIDDVALAGSLRARGGFADGGWSGSVDALEAARPYAARLLAPVALRWRAGALETGDGALSIAGGEIRFGPASAGNGRVSTSGRIERIALAQLLRGAGADGALDTDLVVSGAWDLRAAETLNGRLTLARDGGDVALKGGAPLALGVSELEFTAVARDNALEATLAGRGEKLGELDASLQALAERRGAAWIVAPDAPLALEARFALPTLTWLGPLLAPELRTNGSASGRISAGGTPRNPQLAGEITGKGLRVRYGAAGVRLTDGELSIGLEQDRVIFRRVAFRGGDGNLTATGEATLRGGRAELSLDFSAEHLAAVRQDDRELVVSGSGRARTEGGVLALSGQFTADRGLIELRPEGAPSLSRDVVIVTGDEPAGGAPARLRLDVTLNLGEAFRVRGQGLDVRMVGAIRVRMTETDPRPRANGVVRVAEGRYTAFGQQLAIERGALLFDGPLDNPRLDILAIRRNQRVEAGVAITGTALSPRTALYSNPPVPDSQKLQWLILGSGPSGISDADFGLTSTTRRADEVVSLGAQLTSAVYVSVGQSLRSAGTFVQATLELTERLAVQGRTGAENAVALIYVWSFD